MVFKARKGGKTDNSELNILAATICPTPGSCCITIWASGTAPTNGLTTAPCSNQVLFVSGDAVVAGCNVVAVTSNSPIFVSSQCSLTLYSFTNVTSANECDGTAVCLQGGSNGPTALNLGPSGCTPSIGSCDCNAGTSSSCNYPIAALTTPSLPCTPNNMEPNPGDCCFSITNTMGNTPGTVTGTITGLSYNGNNQAATTVLINSIPAGLGNNAGALPINANSWSNNYCNIFDVSNGVVTNALFGYVNGASEFVLYIHAGSGGTNCITLDSKTTNVQGNNGFQYSNIVCNLQ